MMMMMIWAAALTGLQIEPITSVSSKDGGALWCPPAISPHFDDKDGYLCDQDDDEDNVDDLGGSLVKILTCENGRRFKESNWIVPVFKVFFPNWHQFFLKVSS